MPTLLASDYQMASFSKQTVRRLPRRLFSAVVSMDVVAVVDVDVVVVVVVDGVEPMGAILSTWLVRFSTP